MPPTSKFNYPIPLVSSGISSDADALRDVCFGITPEDRQCAAEALVALMEHPNAAVIPLTAEPSTITDWKNA